MLKSELQAALDLCVEALEAVSFVDFGDSIMQCPWCDMVWHPYRRGEPEHDDDCLHERALAAAQGE